MPRISTIPALSQFSVSALSTWVLAPCNYYANKESYLRSFSFSNIAITSGCVGVNLIPCFNMPITFLAFCSISLAICSLVSIRWFPAILSSRSIYSSVIGNISCIRNALSRLSSSLMIWRMSQGFPLFLFLHNPSVFVNAARQWYHPVYPGTCIFKTVIMRSISSLITFGYGSGISSKNYPW